ncbi:MAG: class I SAM-dependent rRNA methyltransferase [Elusimicrobiota bacterium]
MSTDKPLVLQLKRGGEKRLLRGYPWVFSNELQSLPKTAEPGALAVVTTAKDRTLGAGFFNPNSLIAFRLLSRTTREFDASFLRERLEKALALRLRHFPGARSFRLCHGEPDGLPGLLIDKYEDVLVLQVLAAGMERLLPAIDEALVGLLEPSAIFLKNDHPLRGLEGLPLEKKALRGDVPEKLRIEEDGLRFMVSPTSGEGLGTGFDQRGNRAALAPLFQGRRVLDLCCSAGAFALCAAKHDAVKVLGLDNSPEAVALAAESAALNGLADRCDFDSGDAAEVLDVFAAKKQPFVPDLIILNPPNLAPSKKRLSKALRTYDRLNTQALRILPRGGILATSTCSHHLSREAFVKMLRGAAAKSERGVHLLQLRGQAADHPVLLAMPESEYLHFAVLEVV